MSKLDIIYIAVTVIGMFLFLRDMLSHKGVDEKGTTKKGYNLWSIISGILIGIPMLAYELFRDFFWPRRRRIK